ncbi:MAG: ABC transporter ATP-binding protein [Actinobacteria bacterium HGW-Actinobacteria-7]|jgi:ABC-2 type transport system ATP-binding protein|nr:MAG: ABC transporter ATP-binding protein [Actinobacteria bacterium HGW-Actinobacteria-7]
MAEFAIETHELSRRFGETLAVDALTLSVKRGEIFGFLGHNGAGKTTTVNLLTTLILPTSGTASVCGNDVVDDNLAARQCIGYVPENVRLYNDLTVDENLRFFAELSGVRAVPRRIAEVLALLDRPGWHNRRVGSFSKGMRQRVGIAQALLHEPDVLFLDEPSSGLDPEATREVDELIVRLNREFGMTVFMNTHMLDQVTKICTSIGIMNQGRLMVTDSLEGIKSRFAEDRSLEDIYMHFWHNGTADPAPSEQVAR